MDVTTSNKDRTAATERRQGEGGWRMPPRSVAATGIRRTIPGESSTAQVWPSGEEWGTISCNGNRRPYNAWVGSITSTMAVATTVLPLWGVCCDRFHVLGINQEDGASLLQQVVDRPPIHASPNVAKTMLDWEYVTTILLADLRTLARHYPHAPSPRTAVSDEGSIAQGPGAVYVQTGAAP